MSAAKLLEAPELDAETIAQMDAELVFMAILRISTKAATLSLLYDSIHMSLSGRSLDNTEQILRYHPHDVQTTYIFPCSLPSPNKIDSGSILVLLYFSLEIINVLFCTCEIDSGSILVLLYFS